MIEERTSCEFKCFLLTLPNEVTHMLLLLQPFHNYVPTVERSVKILHQQQYVLFAMTVSIRAARFVFLLLAISTERVFDAVIEFVD